MKTKHIKTGGIFLKKIVSAILALSLAAGMSVCAFAADGDAIGFYKSNLTIADATNVDNNATFTTTIPYATLQVQTTKNNNRVNLTDNQAKNLYKGDDSTTKNGWYNSAITGEYNVTVTKIVADAKGLVVTMKTPTAANQTNKNTYEVSLKFTANGTSNARNASPTKSCTVKISGTISGTVGGAVIDDVVNNGQGVPIGTNGGVYTTGMQTKITGGKPNQLGNLDIRPDSTIKLYLNSSDFDWVDSNGSAQTVTKNSKVTTSKLRNGKITLKKSISKGSKTIDSISLTSDSKGAYAEVKFVEYFVSTSEQDVDFSLYLAKKGSKRSGTMVNIAGTMANEEQTVDAGDDYADLDSGTVVEAEEYVRGIQLYLGNGVSITTNLYKNKKYYGVAVNTVDVTDSKLMDKYSSIDNVLAIKTVNLKGSGKIVSFDMYGSYYVYGADGTYLGLSSEKVTYSDKYYFSTEKITITAADFK